MSSTSYYRRDEREKRSPPRNHRDVVDSYSPDRRRDKASPDRSSRKETKSATAKWLVLDQDGAEESMLNIIAEKAVAIALEKISKDAKTPIDNKENGKSEIQNFVTQ